ncbi:class I SAM-dependent methyltransferase [Halopiger aswanensis]|uniref:Methyltransferase family protein n=1 Tax=Halopiger aswanensis TaxID=148449 RepID=A0A3R7GT53_9EURY|nr:methyltransferase domain-containing protein [Halopiger aswanensis]RKD88627.1 methyltransferase family protein [Halopiger aswanensis]
MVSRRTIRAIAALFGLTLLAGFAYALRWRSNPSPCPYAQRHVIDLPRPVITRSRLRDILEPQPGERLLEVGPGTGYYTGMVARTIESSGTLHAVDIQSEMVEHLGTRMQQEETLNVEPIRGDARSLPYPDDTFDAAYLVLVLGEIPDQKRALDELERVLKPDGRLIVGESLPDPHFVGFEGLRRRIEQRGLTFDARVGTRVGYFARFDVRTADRSIDPVE